MNSFSPKISKAVQEVYHKGLLPVQPKCCGKCAFRKNSIERCDPWKWLALVESFENGGIFLCHEGIPGHGQQNDDAPPLVVCAGFEALHNAGCRILMGLAYLDDREPDPKFLEDND